MSQLLARLLDSDGFVIGWFVCFATMVPLGFGAGWYAREVRDRAAVAGMMARSHDHFGRRTE